MHQTVVEVGREYGISEYIHFVGGKSQKDCWLYAKNSFATLLTCEWNRRDADSFSEKIWSRGTVRRMSTCIFYILSIFSIRS